MAKITYRDINKDTPQTTWNGRSVKDGESFETDDVALIQKAEKNPWFEVSGVSKEQKQQAQVLGNYRDPLSNQEITLVRQAPTMNYGAASQAPDQPAPPSAATQTNAATLVRTEEVKAQGDIDREAREERDNKSKRK